MLSGDTTRALQALDRDISELNLLGELVESIIKKIDENRDYPEAVRVLKEFGMELMTRIMEYPFTPIPDWRTECIVKFQN